MPNFNTFMPYLKTVRPEYTKYVVEVGNKFEKNYKIEANDDDLRIVVGLDAALVIIGFFHTHFDYPDVEDHELYEDIIKF